MKWSKMSTKRRGETSEREVIVELMKRGLDVYVPIADDRGIDGIIRHKGKYYDIQIKTLRNSFASDFNRLPYPKEFKSNYILVLAVTYADKKPDLYFISKKNARKFIIKAPDKKYKGYVNLSKRQDDLD